MASTAHAQIQDFTLIEDFPNQIYAGNTIHAIYSISTTEPTQATIIFTLELQQNITPNIIEFPSRTILLDNTTLNCTEQIFDKGFILNCSANLTNNHNPIIFLTTAPNMAPDTFDYSLTVSPMVDLPLPKPSIPPTPTSFSTGGRGLNIDLPITLNTTVIYLSHLENISYEQYEYHAPEDENISGGGAREPNWEEMFFQLLEQMYNLTNYELTEQRPYLNITYLNCTENPTHLNCAYLIEEDTSRRDLLRFMTLLTLILLYLFYPKIKERFKKREGNYVDKN